MVQCKPITNDSTLPMFIQISHLSLGAITINRKLIFDILTSLNVNKARGPDNISGRMIELCGENITLPLSIIFNNIINTGIFFQIYGNLPMSHLCIKKRVSKW